MVDPAYREIIDRHKSLFDLARMVLTLYGIAIIDGLMIAQLVRWGFRWAYAFHYVGVGIFSVLVFLCFLSVTSTISGLVTHWLFLRSSKLQTALASIVVVAVMTSFGSMMSVLILVTIPEALRPAIMAPPDLSAK